MLKFYFSSAAKTVTVPLAAIAVPPLFVIILTTIAILTIVVLIRVTRKRVTNQQVYYSEAGPPSVPIRTNKNISYQEITPLDDPRLQINSNSALASQNPAYRANIALVPDIETDKNEAYTTTNCQTTMAANLAYGTNVAIAPDIDTQRNLAYEQNNGIMDSSRKWSVVLNSL